MVETRQKEKKEKKKEEKEKKEEKVEKIEKKRKIELKTTHKVIKRKKLAQAIFPNEIELITSTKEKKKKAIVSIEESYWNGWKQIYLVGTEWDLYDEVYKYNWDFTHLQNKLQDENDTELNGKYLYLFGVTERKIKSIKI
jgi:hypothetical protein